MKSLLALALCEIEGRKFVLHGTFFLLVTTSKPMYWHSLCDTVWHV